MKRIILLITVFLVIFSCEKKSKYSEKKTEKIKNLYINIENLAGNLSIYSRKKYIYEFKNTGLFGEVITNKENENFYLKILNFSGISRLFINKDKNIFINSVISGGSLTLSENLNIESLICELNSGNLIINEVTFKKLIITNNFGEVRIKLKKYMPLKISLKSSLSHIKIPDEFILSNNFIYYIDNDEDNTNIMEIEININMGKLEITI